MELMSDNKMVPTTRIISLNNQTISNSGQYVLYWMNAFRRPEFNFALQRSVELANAHKLPLLVFEPLRIGYRWNSERFHQFILDGMRANQRAFAKCDVQYLPFIESRKGEGSGFVEKLSAKSAAVVTDDYPAFFLPALRRRFASSIPVKFEAVDSNGLFPMRLADKVFSRAHFFRIFLQRNLKEHLLEMPLKNPCSEIKSRTQVDLAWLPKKWRTNIDTESSIVKQLDIDHEVKPLSVTGGYDSARKTLDDFLARKLGNYDERRNYPEDDASSRLSGYLHFGHLSAHEVFLSLAKAEDWNPAKIAKEPTKKSSGWWGMSSNSEAFLDQLVTWRELGFNMAWQDRAYDRFDSLPAWAQKTLNEHREDEREYCYSLEEFEYGETHNPLWNAAQTQLRREGVIHNYLRMLWGKKILHWSASPQEALRIMIELNNKYAIDGRDPNSYSGIFWILGRYDRAWGPERPIFGKIRYMAAENTVRKFPVKSYIKKYAFKE